MDSQLPLVKGTVDMLVLKGLTWGPMHGFDISRWLEQRSSGALGLDDSARYQVLHRLAERGFVEGISNRLESTASMHTLRTSA